jgi:hypothetical protein
MASLKPRQDIRAFQNALHDLNETHLLAIHNCRCIASTLPRVDSKSNLCDYRNMPEVVANKSIRVRIPIRRLY